MGIFKKEKKITINLFQLVIGILMVIMQITLLTFFYYYSIHGEDTCQVCDCERGIMSDNDRDGGIIMDDIEELN